MEKITNFKIRVFETRDTDQVIGVIDRVLKDIKVIPESDKKIDDEDLYQIPVAYSGKGRFWVATEKEKVIGTVAIRDMGNNIAKLNRMFVLVDYHGSGVGQKLLDMAINFAKDQEYSEIILNTNLLMHRAHRFYEKNGFVKFAEDHEEFHYRLVL